VSWAFYAQGSLLTMAPAGQAANGLRAAGGAIITWLLRPGNAQRAIDAFGSPPGSSALSPAAIGSRIGQGLRGQADQMGSIVSQVTAAKLTQDAAATAAESAVHAIGKGTAGIVRVGDDLVVRSRRLGDNQYVLIVDKAWKVVKGLFATIEIDEAGKTVVSNVERAQ
jgi:hypothetical protein